MSNSTSPTLLLKVKAKDPSAQQQMILWVLPLINKWCRSVTDSHDREEILQEVFKSLFSSIGAFEQREGKSFRGWLRMITSNKIRDFFRQRKEKPHAVGGDVFQKLLDQMIHDMNHDDEDDADTLLWQAIEQMRGSFSKHVFEAFWLSEVEGLSASEIQKKLGTNPNAIRTAKCRVRQRLRQVYGDLAS
jgi:RNA polymerase sigma-70 factor (ECF subfamily)